VTNAAAATFTLKNGVALYGGFAGTETTRGGRNWKTNVTVLTGDLANDDAGKVNGVTVSAGQIVGTNSWTVVTGSGTTSATVLDGFTVTAGSGGTGGNGGGMYSSNGSPTVTNCTFSGNTATAGGGMYNTGSSPTVTDCTFSGNSAGAQGGGMFNNGSSPTVTNCTFAGNTTNVGGGMCNYNGSSPAVTDCTFAGNNATYGGGMLNSSSSPAATNCTFSGNTAGSYGGGIYNSVSSPTVINCTFSGNAAASSGGGIYNALSSPTVTNCIFWGTGGTGGQIVNVSGSSPVVTYSVTDVAGTGNTTADPMLDSLAWHGGVTETMAISGDSAAFGAGTATGAPTADQRGASRPQGASFDMGAYEYWAGKQVLAVETEGSGTVTQTPGGTPFGTWSNQWSYDTGDGVALSADAAASWYFVAWSGDISGTDPVTTVTMSGDKRVTARFARKWTITASAGTGGAIAPAGNVFILPSADQSFTVTPDAGHTIADVTVDGASAGAAATYTFLGVSADHTIAATFTANPTPAPEPTGTPAPTSPPSPTGTPSPTDGPTPSPFPAPNPDIPLPPVTLTLTLVSGGTVLAGPTEITDPDEPEALLASPALLAQVLGFDPDAVSAGQYNLDMVRFFSLLAQLDPGITELTLLVEISMGEPAPGYPATVFLLARTFDGQGNPTGFEVVPREEGSSVFRRSAAAETWRVTVADGGGTDGDPEAGRVLPNLAAVVVAAGFGATPTAAPSGGGGGCDTGAGGGNGVFGGALPVLLLLVVPTVLLLRR
jgi:hypothetical protein